MSRYNLNLAYTVLRRVCSPGKRYDWVLHKSPAYLTTIPTSTQLTRGGFRRFSSKETAGRCWSCHGKLQSSETVQFMCSKCGSLLKLPEKTVSDWHIDACAKISNLLDYNFAIELFPSAGSGETIHYRFDWTDETISENSGRFASG